MDLRLTYEQVYQEVSEYLGTGDNPVDRDARKAQEIVHKGYKRFLYAREAEEGNRHYWSFLQRRATLNVDADIWQYTLPADFDVMCEDFGFDTNTGYYRCKNKSQKYIMQQRALSDGASFPRYYAIAKQPYDPQVGQLTEVWFYEKPNEKYIMHYSYYFLPEKLSTDTHYFVGGPVYDEVILACCLAEAEVKHTKSIGTMHAHAEILLQQAIKADQATKPSGLGLNMDPGIQRHKWLRPLPWIPPNDVYPE